MKHSLEKLPQLTSEETQNLTSPISIKEIEFVDKNLATKKTPGPQVALLMILPNFFKE